jgi:DNA-binding response OmpR family regulator
VAESDKQGKILLVSRNAQNVKLLADTLLKQGYGVAVATSAGEFEEHVDAEEAIKLALVDLTGFDAAIWPLCERLRTAQTPLLMLAARKSPSLDQTGRAHGANSVLVKPVGVRELVGLIRVMIED